MAWTNEQQAAIMSRGQTLLLSAAAGSGKTAVLVERIVQRIIDSPSSPDITDVLVVTFTKAAATEMRDRIAVALADVAEKTGRTDIERQLALLPAASISTLHSFCQDVIRNYFYTIDLDPSFIIAGEEELSLLRKQVMEEVLLSYYESETKANILYPIVDMFGTARGDDVCMQTIERLYQYAISMPWPLHWLQEAAKAYDIPNGTGIDKLAWSKPIIMEIQRMLRENIRLYGQLIEKLSEYPALEKGLLLFQQEQQVFITAASKTTWQGLQKALVAIEFSRLPSFRKLDEVDKAVWEQCKKIRTDIKKYIQDQAVPTYFSVSEDSWLAGMQTMYPIISGLVDITTDFFNAYREAKKAKQWIDFSDLEHLCLKILLDPASTPEQIIPSSVALELQQKYSEVLMDEYQDTNGVQETIIQLVSRKDNRFMVGDIKQSIYRFRLADPTLFLQKYTQFSREEAATERCIDLCRNFRSAPSVLAAVNEIFEQVMTEETTGLSYGSRERLYAGREKLDDEAWVGGKTEIHILVTDADEEKRLAEPAEEELLPEQTAFEKECTLIAERIQALLASGKKIANKDGSLEPLTYRHIVILLRSLAGKTAPLTQCLQQAGIPSVAEQRGGYFAAIEVQVMISLLQCIDNPEQDIPLTAVLRSPIVGINDIALANLRTCQTGSLWQNLPYFASQIAQGEEQKRVQQFLRQFEEWRTYGRRHGVAELIWRLFTDTSYYDYVGGLPGGSVRQGNLKALYDRAQAYERVGYRGLFRYIRLLEKMQEDGVDLAPANVLGEHENVVRIMSIHKSKGLEFPVVIVADMGKTFNRRDTNELILCHHTLGIGIKQYDSLWRMLYPTLAWNGVRTQLAWESTAEEERILYVAMTRARDKLILVGHTNNMKHDLLRWQHRVHPAQAKSYLDWVMSVVLNKVDNFLMESLENSKIWEDDIWQVQIRGAVSPETGEACAKTADARIEAVRQGILTQTPAPRWLLSALRWQYPFPEAVHMSAKISVSEIKRQHSLIQQADNEELSEPLIKPLTEENPFMIPPAWERPQQDRVSGAMRGTAMHKAMQYIPLQVDLSLADIRAYLVEQTQKGHLTSEESEMVDIIHLQAFLQSDIGKCMARSPEVHREYPFSVLLKQNTYLPSLEKGEAVLVQGIIDALFLDQDEWILLDYKNDFLPDKEAFIKRYRVQLDIYKEAIEQVTGKRVKEMYLFSFYLQQAIIVP